MNPGVEVKGRLAGSVCFKGRAERISDHALDAGQGMN